MRPSLCPQPTKIPTSKPSAKHLGFEFFGADVSPRIRIARRGLCADVTSSRSAVCPLLPASEQAPYVFSRAMAAARRIPNTPSPKDVTPSASCAVSRPVWEESSPDPCRNLDRPYYVNWNLRPIDLPCAAPYDETRMTWELIVVLNVVFAISAAVLWSACSGSKKSTVRKHEIRHRHDEFEIDPANVPHFKPTWRNAQ